MDAMYDVVKIKRLWHVCRLIPSSVERWELVSGGYKTRAEAFTDMHGQRFADNNSRQLKRADVK